MSGYNFMKTGDTADREVKSDGNDEIKTSSTELVELDNFDTIYSKGDKLNLAIILFNFVYNCIVQIEKQ